jgi:SAM-dependent methyltransferase
MPRANRASIEFSLTWQSPSGRHCERLFVPTVDFWRDVFPGEMGARTAALGVGESASDAFEAGVLVPAYDDRKLVRFNESAFGHRQRGRTITPKVGRFYPQGFAWTALGCFRGDYTPFRIVSLDGGAIAGDTNHPLARFPLTLAARCVQKLGPIEERGGTCNHIAEALTNGGPGMQIAHPAAATDFHAPYPLPRRNDDDDADFYREPRLVAHLDATAIGHVSTLYGRLLLPGTRVLDLMSSWASHLPPSLDSCSVVGLGMNEQELRANERLAKRVLHDLNRKPELPFDHGQFDAVVCTASIEYLTRPLEVVAEVSRVLKPGGVFVTTFSDRWFPGKEIEPWSDLHRFERLGYVLDLYAKSGTFGDLHTETIRGWPRPDDDAHVRQTTLSDPVYAVWGRARR